MAGGRSENHARAYRSVSSGPSDCLANGAAYHGKGVGVSNTKGTGGILRDVSAPPDMSLVGDS